MEETGKLYMETVETVNGNALAKVGAGPQSQVRQDLLDNVGRVNKSDEPGGGGISTVPAGDPFWVVLDGLSRFPGGGKRCTLKIQKGTKSANLIRARRFA